MKLEPMRYKEYSWPQNPSHLKITHKRDVKELRVPYGESVLQDFGACRQIIEGQGAFFGANALSDYSALEKVFQSGGTGTLLLPGMPARTAVFSSLAMAEEPRPDYIRYTFLFIEDSSGSVSAGTQDKRLHTVSAGENMWTIASLYGTTVDKLMSLNPGVRWPGDLSAGERVALP